MKRISMAAIILLCAMAQSGPKFDVASVKLTSHGRTADGWSHSWIEQSTPGRLVGQNASMMECLRWAFEVKDYQVIGPNWLNADEASYDIEAKAPPETTHGDMHKMMQSLLAERFQLAVHREQRMLPSYELVVGKNGHKMTPSTKTDNSQSSRGGHVTCTGISMKEWAYQLSRFTKLPVFDMTGITGNFDFKLDYEGDNKEEGMPSLFTALQEQIGLKLESAKRPVDVIVIDHVERVPSGN